MASPKPVCRPAEGSAGSSPSRLSIQLISRTAGNSAIAGHRDTHFAALRELAPGDRLIVETPDGRRRSYRAVETLVVREDAGWLLAPAEEPMLTLITCYPFDAVAPGGPLRWVVRAVADPAT